MMADLINKWQTGDMSAFEALFQQYKGLVFKNAILMTGNREEAEDILQDVFMTVWKSRHTFNPTKGKFVTWLYRITVNQSIDRQRRKQPASLSLEETNLDLPNANYQESPEEAIASKLEHERLANAVNHLDGKHRPVLVLRYFNGLSYREIAEVLDIPLGTVKSRIHQALKSLRRQPNPIERDVNKA